MNNTLSFCPLCARDTLQKKLDGDYQFCTRCKQKFKITKNLLDVKELDPSDIEIYPVNDFAGWDESELKEEIFRLQQILDSKGIGY